MTEKSQVEGSVVRDKDINLPKILLDQVKIDRFSAHVGVGKAGEKRNAAWDPHARIAECLSCGNDIDYVAGSINLQDHVTQIDNLVARRVRAGRFSVDHSYCRKWLNRLFADDKVLQTRSRQEDADVPFIIIST